MEAGLHLGASHGCKPAHATDLPLGLLKPLGPDWTKLHCSSLSHQLPIVYEDVYNVTFMGIENLHVFDSKKFGRIVSSLERRNLLQISSWHCAATQPH